MSSWRVLTSSPLQLSACLSGGQSFRWKFDKETEEWTGIFRKTIWKLRQDDSTVSYKLVGSLNYSSGDEDGVEAELIDYFHLKYDLEKLYDEWSEKDPLFALAAKKFNGVRMLNQEVVENIFSFICSQNNHISRISSMIDKLCAKYGEKICSVEGVDYHAFPDFAKLSNKKVDGELRTLGFGYRSKFIQQSAEKIEEWGGEEWIKSLKDMPYSDAKIELIKLPGIGPKVADCICLMSLGHLQAVPVDTHVFQIAANNYLKHLKGAKSVTDRIYNEIGEHFRNLYGPLAGWAHTILFCADLKKFDEKPAANKVRKRRVRTK